MLDQIFSAFLTQKRVNEFECHADAGEMFVGIFAARLIRINDGKSVGISFDFVGQMVVGNYQINAVRFCPIRRFKRAASRINADDERVTFFLRLA